jgi:Cu(I)/Ag(I) efflux system membrane protein CusA/SilA
MKLVEIEANIVALSGIAIAIGVMVDVAVVMMENVVKKLEAVGAATESQPTGKALEQVIFEGVSEVSGAIMTAMATTVVSFIPVFAMQAQEGKMFHPLAFTKTFALLSALLLGFLLLPPWPTGYSRCVGLAGLSTSFPISIGSQPSSDCRGDIYS